MGRAAAATAVATLRGDGARRSESAARAAENAGVLAGALRPRPEAHPRASGPQLGGSAGRAPSAPFILLYHRIADPAADPLKLCVSPEHFEEHLAALEQDFTVVSMDEMAAERAAGAVAITFDDGYADNVAAFAQLELPVTLYAATGHIAEQRPFFWDELAALFSQGDQPTLTVEIDGRRLEWPTRNPEERQAAMRDLHRRLQPTAPETIEAALTQVRAWARSGATPPPLMTVDDLRGLGVDVGAHTVRHLNLAHQTRDVLEAEVTGSRDAVAEWTGSSPRGFSYPFGLPRHDVDDVAMRVVEEAGFDYAVVNQPTPVLAEADRFALPRLFAPNVSGAELRAWLRPIVC
jgi:peptidoglycan/xylan/chitin deacetylase (PgdA/CDA1 family)